MSPAAAHRRSIKAVAITAALLGLVVVPLVMWLMLPGLPARLESMTGFLWVGETTGAPLVLRAQDDGSLLIAGEVPGSNRAGIPRGEPVRCYAGPSAPLAAVARDNGRLEGIALASGLFHRLTVNIDLGGGQETYLYRCGADGVQPLLSWGLAPGFGVRALAIGWVAWIAIWLAALGLTRAIRPRRA